MVDLLVAAIPAFILLMAAEVLSYRHLAEEARAEHTGYELRDTRTSILMGLGNLTISGVWNVVALAIFAALYLVSPLEVDMGSPWAWVLLLVLFDFFFYWDHRLHHVIRVGWASHVVHHSSEHFNLSTAVRQPWVPFSSTLFFMPLPLLGFPPAAIALVSAIDLLYQFWIHTERIDRMPRWFEAVFNTPSHHRVHHGSDAEYLDRNYGGIFIVFDRMFGTFQAEGARPKYGLTKNIDSFNPLRVAFHEWGAIAADVRRADRLRDRLGYLFGPPGWTPKSGDAAGATGDAPAAPSGPLVVAPTYERRLQSVPPTNTTTATTMETTTGPVDAVPPSVARQAPAATTMASPTKRANALLGGMRGNPTDRSERAG